MAYFYPTKKTILSTIKPLKAPPGFTLIEILLVLVLLGIIAGLALPNFSESSRDLQLQAATNDLAYLMRYTQIRAMTQGQTLSLILDPLSKAYWIEESQETSFEGDPQSFRRVTGRYGKTFHLPEGVSLETLLTPVFFHPNGAIDKTRIKLCQKDRCRDISTQAQRGYVHILEDNE